MPPGIEIHTSYDRSNLIHRAIDTLKTKLLEELIVVAFMFGEVRAELQSNGDRLARIERLLDAPTAVRNP